MNRGCGMQKGNRKFYRGLAVMVSVALLIGQGSFSVMAEESGEMSSVSGGDAEYNVSEESSGEEIMPEDMLSVSGNDAEGNIDEEPSGEEITAGAAASVESPQEENEEYFYYPKDSHDQYKILSDSEVELVLARSSYVMDNCKIPAEAVDSLGNVYTVTSIGDKAFWNGDMQKVEIPNTITTIGNNAFQSCDRMTSIQIPDSVMSIGEGAFWNCKELTSVEIPNSVTSIGQGAFSMCSNLKNANIPNGITTVSDMLFAWTSLEEIEIPDSVTTIGLGAFRYCNFTSIQIPNSVTIISDDAFSDCKALTSIEIPDSVMRVGANAFSGCDNLVSVKLPQNLGYIKEYTFMECTKLTNITIPDSVESIGQNAFWECATLGNITIPSGVTYIDFMAFCDCNNLQSLEIAVKTEEEGGIQKIKPILLGDRVFDGYSAEGQRTLIFLTEDGRTELSDTTSPTLAEAQEAYRNVDDGNPNDNYWYGWYLGEIPAEVPATEYNISYRVDNVDVTGDSDYSRYAKYTEGTGLALPVPSPREGYTFDGWYRYEDYTGDKAAAVSSVAKGDKVFYGRWIEDKAPVYSVTIQVYIDNEEWTDHGRTFALYEADEDLVVDNLSEVKEGTYEIYDVTGTQGKSLRMAGLNMPGLSIEGLNTGVTVEVKEENSSARVDYYTATFYDGETAYGEDTPQRQQVILKGYPVSGPEGPTKVGVEFQGWMTEARGGVSFDFAQAIQEKTAIYASWKEKESDDDTPGNSDTPGGESTPGGEDTPSGDDKPGNSNTSGDTNNPGERDDSANGINNSGYDIRDSNIAENGAVNKTEANDKEPKTGDASHMEIYATIAMIAGLLYLLFYFADRERGMTEEEKNQRVSALIRWAKRGGRLRRYVAIAAIFCLLCYYHSIGHSSAAPKTQAA